MGAHFFEGTLRLTGPSRRLQSNRRASPSAPLNAIVGRQRQPFDKSRSFYLIVGSARSRYERVVGLPAVGRWRDAYLPRCFA